MKTIRRRGWRWRAAYHEAGHAIATWVVGRTMLGRQDSAVRSVWIKSRKEGDPEAALGECRRDAFYPHGFLPAGGLLPGLDQGADVREWRLRLEAELISILAGAEAEARISRRSIDTINEQGALGDVGLASTLLVSFFGADDPANPEQQTLWWGVASGARRLIGHHDAWVAIDTLAVDLIERGEVAGCDVSRIAEREAGFAFPVARVMIP